MPTSRTPGGFFENLVENRIAIDYGNLDEQRGVCPHSRAEVTLRAIRGVDPETAFSGLRNENSQNPTATAALGEARCPARPTVLGPRLGPARDPSGASGFCRESTRPERLVGRASRSRVKAPIRFAAGAFSDARNVSPTPRLIPYRSPEPTFFKPAGDRPEKDGVVSFFLNVSDSPSHNGGGRPYSFPGADAPTPSLRSDDGPFSPLGLSFIRERGSTRTSLSGGRVASLPGGQEKNLTKRYWK